MSQNPVKVIHVTSRLNVGGLAVQVLNVCAGIEGDEFECTVITGTVGWDEGDMLNYMIKPKRLHVIPELGRKVSPFADLVAFIKLCDYFRSEKPDIVHTHASKAGTIGRLAAWIAYVPVIVHSYHGHVFRHYFSATISFILRLVDRILGLMTSAVVLPCKSQVDEIVDEFRIVPSSKATIVRYGIDVSHFADNPHQRAESRIFLGLDQDSLLIGAIGRLTQIKNHKLLIEAFNIIPETINDRRVELLIHGGGVCLTDIKRQIEKLDLSHRVHFVEWVEDLRIVYAAIDVLAIASKAEGMSISALEAMASSVPVVSTAVGGMADLIDDFKTGMLVKDQRPEMLAAKLIFILERKDGFTDNIKKKAHEHVMANHGMTALVEDTKNLYRRLMASCQKRP